MALSHPPSTWYESNQMPPPTAQDPQAMTTLGLGTESYSSFRRGSALRVTGPETSSTSACRGEPTSFNPKRSAS